MDFQWFELLVSCCITRLDVYIYDYLVKRNLQTSAKAFQAEGKVSLDPVGKSCALYFIATNCILIRLDVKVFQSFAFDTLLYMHC